MKRKQMLFIYNPNAGRGTFAPKLSDVIDTFVKADYEVVVRPTQARLDAYEEVKSFRYPYDIVPARSMTLHPACTYQSSP